MTVRFGALTSGINSKEILYFFAFLLRIYRDLNKKSYKTKDYHNENPHANTILLATLHEFL
jgi:hypothetical protein